MPLQASDGIVCPFPALPAPAATIEVAPGVFWLRMPLPFALNHINLWLIEDGDGWCIVDTGLNSQPIRDLWLALRAGPMLGRPVTRIIVTHYHPDHIGLAAWLAGQADCGIWMTAGEHRVAARLFSEDNQVRTDFFRRHGLAGEHLAGMANWGASYRRNVAGVPPDFNVLQDGQVLRIGAHDWQVIVGRGHSPEHATLHCSALDVLLAGDQILPAITPHISVWHLDPEGDPVRLFLASLDRFGELPAQTLVLPAHGTPFTGLHPRLAFLARHHALRLQEVLDACREPRCAADIMQVLFSRRLDSQQIPFAMGESIAHLNHLYHKGELVRSSDAAGILRFQRSGAP
ncbi:MAG: MBL fold metallo-hydrolase [Gammaproteobacteria bacterium]|nr:MBL fold metallo-hydrolase [Gammaproteobacteria bacterium]